MESLLITEKQVIYREGFWVKLALTRIFTGNWPSLYVLGTGIRNRLISKFPHLETLRNIKAVEHPYTFSRIARPRKQARIKRRIGFVGVGRRIKGIVSFFQLARSLSALVSAGNLEFVVVGGLEKGVRQTANEWVTILSPTGAGLSTKDYRQEISQLDCAVFLPSQNYSLTASGSIFDVINEGVEILSLQSDYVLDLSERDSEGGIKLFSSPEDIKKELLRRVRCGWPTELYTYTEIKKLHSEQSTDVISAEVFSQDI